MKLNLACGRDYMDGYINADISYDVNADVVFDMTKGIPYPENHFNEVIVNNALTQIEKNIDFVNTINDLWRITKPKGSIFIRVPLATHECSFQDPMDCRRFTDQSFTYMQYNHRRYLQYGCHYGFKPFKVQLLDNNVRQMTFKLCPKKD